MQYNTKLKKSSGPNFIIIQSGLSLIQTISGKIIRKNKGRIYSLPMHVHKHKLYLLEQHSKSFDIWSAIMRINTKGKSLILKCWPWYN